MMGNEQRNLAKLLEASFPFWDTLTMMQKERLVTATMLRAFPAQAHIRDVGSDSSGVILVLKGILRSYILAENGREISLFRIREGENCVLSAACVLPLIDFDVFVDAETDTEILTIAPEYLCSLMEENPRIAAYVYRQATERISQVLRMFYQFLFVSLDKRLAAYLLSEASGGYPRVLQRTHEDIAKDLGSAREVVSRMLKHFRKKGFVLLTRGKITIIDESQLTRLV